MKTKFEFFWALAYEKTKTKHDLPPLLSRILCSSLLFVDDLFSVCFQERLRISFSRYFSLDIFAFLSPCSAYFGACSNFLARFSRLALRRLPVSFFGRSVSFYPADMYFHSKSSFHELEFKQFPSFDKALALPVLLLCKLIRNCKILRITVQLKPRQFDFPIKTRVANYLITQLHIYQPLWSPRVMPNRVPAVCCTKARHASMRTSLSSCWCLLAHATGVSKLCKQSSLRIIFFLALPLCNS